MKILFFILAMLAPAAANAADEVALSSQIFVEKTVTDARGEAKTVRQVPAIVTPGDRLVFVLAYKNGGTAPATGFTVTNPIPASVSFASVDAAGAELSIDGGKSWGQLSALKVAAADGTRRPAVVADVTHIRWSFSRPIPVGGNGELSFRGTVK
jgi:uncharacterized repeat protein (TIGR01451 family)